MLKHRRLRGTKTGIVPLTSSGIPSLDVFVGGGLPLGGVCLFFEDDPRCFSDALERCFLSEGAVNGHDLYILTSHFKSTKIIEKLPRPVDNCSYENRQDETRDKLQIAWRYERYPNNYNNEMLASKTFGHRLDLNKHLESDEIKSIHIYEKALSEYVTSSEFSSYDMVLSDLNSIVPTYDPMNASNSTILRILLQSFLSPLWLNNKTSEAVSDKLMIFKFLHHLRCLIREKCAVCYLTVPSYILHCEELLEGLTMFSDFVLIFRQIAKSKDNLLMDFDGFCFVRKLDLINSLVPRIPDSGDIVYKIRHHRALLEQFNPPPEPDETANRERTILSGSAKMSCASFHDTNKFDF